jgi:hypothetical protein
MRYREMLRLMSARGQLRRFEVTPVTSALAELADIIGAAQHFALGPITDISGAQSITSSARSKSAGGIVSPISFAAFMLMIRSNLTAR